MRSPLALISTSIALLVAAAPGQAAASPTYPGDIQADLGLTFAPPCTICHNSLAGGAGSVVQPFGVAMKAQGLVLEDPAALQAALDALDMLKSDSNCDKIADIDELKAGRDPNTGASIDGSTKFAGGMACAATPAYGCAAPQARVASEPAAWEGALAVAAALGISLARRRAR
jgi:hypothetical protein